MAAVLFSLIWFQQTFDYQINPMIVAVYVVGTPYMATLGIIRLIDWRARRLDAKQSSSAGSSQSSMLKRPQIDL